MAGTDYIDFATMAGFTREMVLAEIDSMIKTASVYGGRVFGGYVRDVLVPRKFNPTCPVQFKDVDLWFITESAKDIFLRNMGDRLRIMPNFPAKSDLNLYTFERQQYNLFSHGTCVAWIDIVVSGTFPVNDFDVNCLTGRKMDGVGKFASKLPHTANDLIESIKAKRANILPFYAKILTGDDSKAQIHRMRVQHRYLERGWKVFYGDEQYTGPIAQSIQATDAFHLWIVSQVCAETCRLATLIAPVPSTPTPPAPIASVPAPISSSSTPIVSVPAASISESETPISGSITSIFNMATKIMSQMGVEPPPGMKMPTESDMADAINSIFNNPANQNDLQELLSRQQSDAETISIATRIVKNSTEPIESVSEPVAPIESIPIESVPIASSSESVADTATFRKMTPEESAAAEKELRKAAALERFENSLRKMRQDFIAVLESKRD